MIPLLKSIAVGIFISSIIFMGFAVLASVLMAIEHFLGMEFTYGFIFLIAVVIFSVLHYQESK